MKNKLSESQTIFYVNHFYIHAHVLQRTQNDALEILEVTVVTRIKNSLISQIYNLSFLYNLIYWQYYSRYMFPSLVP